MNLAALDLNLLVALDALLHEAHVGRAAKRVGLSQPAMSHALQRAREALSDPLLVRVGASMAPTPRAVRLRAPVAATLDQIRGLFAPDSFEPARSTRRFRLMMPDLVVDLLLAPLARQLALAAPGVQLEVVPWLGSSGMTPELARSVDAVVACLGDGFPGFHRRKLYRDSDALAVRRGHPRAARLARLDGFLAARHIAVVGRGAPEDPIDAWLRGEGHERPIAVVTPSYLTALHLAAGSDLVAFVPRRLIAAVSRALRLVAVQPPLDPGTDEQSLYTPVQAETDPASIWLRQNIAAIANGLAPSLSV